MFRQYEHPDAGARRAATSPPYRHSDVSRVMWADGGSGTHGARGGTEGAGQAAMILVMTQDQLDRELILLIDSASMTIASTARLESSRTMTLAEHAVAGPGASVTEVRPGTRDPGNVVFLILTGSDPFQAMPSQRR